MNSPTNTIQSGCYIDSHMGHYAIPESIKIAVSFGFHIDPFAQFALDAYDSFYFEDNYPSESLIELSDEAIDWLNSTPTMHWSGDARPPVRPENTYWGWNDGDFGLWPEEDFGDE